MRTLRATLLAWKRLCAHRNRSDWAHSAPILIGAYPGLTYAEPVRRDRQLHAWRPVLSASGRGSGSALAPVQNNAAASVAWETVTTKWPLANNCTCPGLPLTNLSYQTSPALMTASGHRDHWTDRQAATHTRHSTPQFAWRKAAGVTPRLTG
jgi:hypothetical protein